MTGQLDLRGKTGERGSVFVLAMVTLTVLLFLAVPLIQNAQTAVHRSAVQNRSAQCLHLAEAGIHKAIYELADSNGWQTYDGGIGAELGPGRFDVSVSPAAITRTSDSLVRITATGYLPGADGAPRLPRRVQVVLARGECGRFGRALVAQGGIDVGNADIDSYRSEDGAYGAGNVGSNADIAVNTTTYETTGGGKKAWVTSGINVGDNGVLNGSLLVGAGTPDPYSATNVTGTVNGSVEALDSPLVIDPVTIPPEATDLGAVSLSGNDTMTLASGAYRVESLSITGNQASLFVAGDVTLYVVGEVNVEGNGIVNQDPGKPRNLIIYGTPTCTSIRIAGASTFYGAAYAPNADIELQGSTTSGEIFGAFVGKNVKLMGNQTRLHYDECLDDSSGGGIQVRSWQEL